MEESSACADVGDGARAHLAAERAGEAGDAIAADPTFAGHRLVDGAEHRHAVLEQPDQGAKARPAGDEGAGAVNRVDHPDAARAFVMRRQFLADDAVIGKARGEDFAQRLLGQAVGDGDRALVGFLLSGHAGTEIRADHRAGCIQRRRDPCKPGVAHGLVSLIGEAEFWFK